MRAAEGMHVEWVDQEAVVLDPQTSRLHYLNPPAALAYALILEHGYDGALEQLEGRARDGENPEELRRLIDDMVEKGLLVDE